jgi:nitroimidazol reductase NimA-like FMN-containing flavoprotein (pyridoxamine 5'-phosphate oxidase superfamily)
MIRPLSYEDAYAVLAEHQVGRLGCVDEMGPYVVPISYVIHNDSLYSHSLLGRKIEALRKDPRVCLQVDRISDDSHWKSAIAFEKYEEVTDPEIRAWIIQKFFKRFPHLTPVESVPVHDGQSSVIIYRIRIEQVTGVGEG